MYLMHVVSEVFKEVYKRKRTADIGQKRKAQMSELIMKGSDNL